MSTVDISCGDETTLELDSALLLYRGRAGVHGIEQVYVTRHAARVIDGEPTLLAGQPVTKQQLASFVSAASKHIGNFGFIHERAIYTAPGTVAWWTPAARRTVWFQAEAPLGTRHGEADHPALLFVAHGRQRFVFAMKASERPTPETQLFQAPYFNVSGNGWICTGNVDCTEQPHPADIEAYETEEFFRSRFTHPNAPKLVDGGSAVRLWMDLLDGAPFPTERLLSIEKTVGSVIKQISNRS
ncbi:hypothetical protein WI36_20080 [Burkholderia ubonensis]|uniref:PRTRC system protein B n=1 Tax=Burkholderia ubonensis TaxID=101571 RepID=UPI0007581942|nr:PRTRC system protein B [Burkholderia ubonensis]KUZ70793.1 hypothetical protein WI36_20080 [Burkholderia ubonensis]